MVPKPAPILWASAGNKCHLGDIPEGGLGENSFRNAGLEYTPRLRPGPRIRRNHTPAEGRRACAALREPLKMHFVCVQIICDSGILRSPVTRSHVGRR